MPQASPSIQPQDLSHALHTLQSSLSILFFYYKPYLKLIFLILCGYLSYKLGDLSVSDKILQQRKNLSAAITRRQISRVHIPKKIKQLGRITQWLIILLVVGAGTVIALDVTEAEYFGKKFVVKKHLDELLITGGGLLLLIVLVSLYKLWLSALNSSAKIQSTDRQISKQLTQFTQALGAKVVMILKNHLCKEKIKANVGSRLSVQCSKNECKQLRALYKSRNDSISHLTEKFINFQWCTVCRNRGAFDEYLPYEAPVYVQKEILLGEEVKEQDQAMQAAQVKARMEYMIEGLSRMTGWLNQTSPCNCSKLYWNSSTKDILQYKMQEKSTSIEIERLQRKKVYLTGAKVVTEDVKRAGMQGDATRSNIKVNNYKTLDCHQTKGIM